MPTKVIMPQMGESIFEGTITKWLKKAGENVRRDEPLFEISTDKVDSEIPSPASGTVQEILFAEGKTVQINTVVALIAGEDEVRPSPAPVPEPDPVKEPLPEPTAQPPASTMAPPSPAPQDPAAAAAAEEHAESPEPESRPRVPGAPAPDTRTSPLVRRMAREHSIDLAAIRGTGMAGRITKQDILDHLAGQSQAAAPTQPVIEAATDTRPPVPQAPAAAAPPLQAGALPPPAAQGIPSESETVPMTTMRKAIAEHMVMSKRTSAHVNTVFEADMSAIVRLREQHGAEFEKREGIKLTFTPFFVKALADTVREFPVFNCSVSGDNIIYKKAIHVGVAVALESGLIVPVVKDAHLKSFTGIALAIHDLASRARSKRLRPDDVQNGTISITNPGIYGSLFGTPIISQPQVAILGVGGIEKRPVVVNDAIAIRSMVYLSLSFDHRVIDGAVADQFMASLKKRLESWIEWRA